MPGEVESETRDPAVSRTGRVPRTSFTPHPADPALTLGAMSELSVRGYALTADEGVTDREAEVKASNRSTGGSLAVYRSIVDGQGPPFHIHRHEDEAIFVLSGVLEAECGEETLTAHAGGFIFLPRGFGHTFRSVDGPAEILFMVAPGRIDEFFLQRDRLTAEGADPAEISRLVREYM